MRCLALCLVGLTLSCHSSATDSTPEFPFDLSPMSDRHPYPSLRAHGEDGHLRVPAWFLEPAGLQGDDLEKGRAFLALLQPMLEELRGVSMTAELKIPYAGVLDAETLEGDLLVLSADGLRTSEVEFAIFDGWLEVSPSTTWEAGADQVVVIRGASDARCRASKGVRALFAGQRGADEQLRVETALSGAGIAIDDVCLGYSFRVHNVEEQIVDLRSMLAERLDVLPPSVTITKIQDASEIVWREEPNNIDRLVWATYQSPELRGDDSLVIPERLLGDVVAPSSAIEFAIVLPKRDPDATGPIPVVMGLHGLGSDLESTLRLYGPYLASAGFAYVSIDGVQHGKRRETDASSFEAILDVRDPRRSRDMFVQTLVDLMQLRYAIASGVVIDETTVLATDEIRWSGGSYGGIFGLMMAVADPQIVAVHSEAAGGPWRDIIRTTDLARLWVIAELNKAAGLNLNAFDRDMVAFAWQYAELAQWIVDSGDVSSYAQHLLSRPIDRVSQARVLMQYWKGETLMPNTASERVARSLGVGWEDSSLDDAGVATVWPFVVEDWGVSGGVSAHGAFWDIPEAREQALHYLLSEGREVIDPAAPGDQL